MRRFLATSCLLLMTVTFLTGCLFRRHRGDLASQLNPGDQPDKILFEKASNEIQRGRFDVGRLTLQTLINTYPDSEFLAKAKLVIADSYYDEGGVSGLTQAEAEYKDFITFFPTAPEAPEAQFRVGMAHFRLMAKADRDRTEAKLAELEFKEFLLKYPDSPLVRRVKARLRQVQEVLAQGDFKIAKFYYSKSSLPAARSRFQEIVDQYPNFSRGDQTLWYLGQTFERLKKPRESLPYYARIITEHPLSSLVSDAKERLVAMNQPIPRPTRAMLARAQADAARRPRRDMLEKLGSMMSSGPDTSATLHGPVRLGTRPSGEVEVAKTAEPASSGSTIVVQPVGDASLSAGQAVDPKSANNGTTKQKDDSSGKDANPAGESKTSAPTSISESSQPTVPAKKNGRFHFFKKLVKPF